MVLRGTARAPCCGYLAAADTFLLRPLARIILPLRLVFRWALLLRAQLEREAILRYRILIREWEDDCAVSLHRSVILFRSLQS